MKDNKKTKIHFIGINGSGISGVACIAKQNGYDVDGCDYKAEMNNYTQQLIDNDIKMHKGHDVEHLKDMDMVVLTPALLYRDRYKQIEETRVAMETKKAMKWQKFLGEYIMKDKNVVAVSGTHGKTTTTTLVALMLENGNFDPTVFIGGVVKEWGSTYRVGKSDYYVCEGDEYDGNFLHYNPKFAIINNLEMEHPERFDTFEDYKENFKNFLFTIQKNGVLVFNFDDKDSRELILSLNNIFLEKNIKLISFTFNENLNFENNYKNLEIKHLKKEKNSIIIDGNVFEYKLMGEHNAKNIASATLLSTAIGVDVKSIQDFLKGFSGTKRRIDLVYSDEKVKLYDDYAHHHTQVECAMKAIKENLEKDEKIIAILEPHLISRIRDNTKEYEEFMGIAEYPIITKIFKSRESFLPDLDVNSIIKNKNIKYIEDFDLVISKTKEIIAENKDSRMVIVVMGAGNSYKIAEELKNILSNK